MSFTKINYKDNESIITADNLNNIQDAILEGYQPDGTIEYADFAESTKLALLNLIYPIGSIYMSTDDISPANQFGGTWEQIKDRFILAAGSSYTAGATGGEASVTLTINQMPSHRHHHPNNGHTFSWGDTNSTIWLNAGQMVAQSATNNGLSSYQGPNNYTEYSGGSQAHNNMPPYLVAYMWKRVA